MKKLLFKRLRRSLWRIKLRVIMVLFLITLATWLSISMAEHTRNADNVYLDMYTETNLGDLFADSKGTFYPASSFDSACSNLSSFASQQGLPVNSCESRLSMSAFFLDEDAKWASAKLHGFGPGQVNKLYYTSGNWPEKAGEVVLDDHLAEYMDLEVGDNFSILIGDGQHNLTLSGIAVSPEHLFYVPDGGLFPSKGGYAVLYLPVEELTSMAGIDANLRNRLLIDLEGEPDYDLQDTSEDEGVILSPLKAELLHQLSISGIETIQVGDRGSIYSVELLRLDLEGAKKSLPLFTIVLAVVSGLVIAISMDRMVRSQSREIAVLRTLGVPRNQILLDYMMVPLSLGVIGSSLGLLLAISPFGSEWLTSWYFSFFGIPIVKINHYPDLLLKLCSAVLFIVLAFGIRPALKASRLMPLDVMRQGSGKKPAKWLAKLTNSLPPTMGLGVRSTFRKPQRLAVTILALGLALILTGSTMLMMASMEVTFKDANSAQNKWDSEISYLPWNKDSISAWIDSTEIEESQFVARYFANASGDERPFMILAMGDISTSKDALRTTDLVSGELPIAGANPTQVLIDEGMALHLNWKIGEKQEVIFGASTIKVEIVGTTSDMMRTMSLHLRDFETATEMGANLIWIQHEEGIIDDDLRGLSWSITSSLEMQNSIDELMETQAGVMAVMLFVGWSIALAILLNTLLINLSERDTEFATLRILGASRGTLTKILLIEHAIIGLFGGLFGAFSSYFLASALSAEFSTWAFHLPLLVNWWIIGQIILYVFIAAILTTPVGIWRINKMDLIEQSKDIS
ncbi:MAG: FtsX-like permease family protein [Euryarchaeota archaeon]|nr:FtsX-like permease family protein [Euryarchaeota archaeon]